MKIQLKSSHINTSVYNNAEIKYFDALSLIGTEISKEKFKEFYCHYCFTPILFILIVLCSAFSLFVYWTLSSFFNYQPLGKFLLNENSTQYEFDISWSNCGTVKYGKVNQLKVQPNTIDLNKNLTLWMGADVFQDLGAPISLTVELKKKVWIKWITLPCIKNIGSCSYNDICSFNPNPQNKTCIVPLARSFIPCSCPLNKGKYFANGSVITLTNPASFIPSWLMSGFYWAQLKAFVDGKEVGCYAFHLSVRT